MIKVLDMLKHTIFVVIFISCYNMEELPYLNLKSLNVAYIPANSNLVNEDCYYISYSDSLGKILTEELLNSDTTLLANAYLPNLCHHIHYYEDDGIVIYSKYLGNPTADAYTITLNLRLRQESSDDFIISYDVK